MVIIQRRYGILLFPWAIYWLLICAMPVACAIPIVYIERSELGAKDPYGSLAHLLAALVQHQALRNLPSYQTR